MEMITRYKNNVSEKNTFFTIFLGWPKPTVSFQFFQCHKTVKKAEQKFVPCVQMLYKPNSSAMWYSDPSDWGRDKFLVINVAFV